MTSIKKTLAENLTKKLVLFSALPLRSGHFVLISHIFTCLHVLISSSSLLIDFLSRCSSLFHLPVARSLLDSVSSDSQSYHRTTSLVCFGSVTLCHQICFVLHCVNVMQDLSTSSPLRLAHTCTSASHVSFFQVLSWMPMLLQTDCQHG